MKRFKPFLVTVFGVAMFPVLSTGAASAQQRVPAPVVVTNTPLWTANVNDPAFEPFQLSRRFVIPPGADSISAELGSVPAGKRLVAEFVSGVVLTPSGQRGCGWSPVYVGFIPVGHVVWISQGTRGDGAGVSVTSQPIRLYADGGERLFVTFCRDGSSESTDVEFSITGYLVHMPPLEEIR